MALFGLSLNPIDWITDAAGEIVDGAAGAFIDVVVGWVEEALTWATQQIALVLTDLSAPDFGSSAFQQLGGTFKWLALVSLVATIMLACAGALLNPKVELSHVVREIPITMVMLAGWYAVVAVWFEGCRALTAAFTGDALRQAFATGISLDAGIASFFRLLICLLMIVFLLVFMIEMFVLQHMLTFAAVIGPLSIALRPWPALKDVSANDPQRGDAVTHASAHRSVDVAGVAHSQRRRGARHQPSHRGTRRHGRVNPDACNGVQVPALGRQRRLRWPRADRRSSDHCRNGCSTRRHRKFRCDGVRRSRWWHLAAGVVHGWWRGTHSRLVQRSRPAGRHYGLPRPWDRIAGSITRITATG
ncbi:MAG: hypothetical protein IPL07_21890 [Acidimicrobiaceae bacterium]|nr:hypothetical protein [Acidimicrobiaceae bacterium]